MRPDISLLAKCEESLANNVEKAWIALFIDNGYDLVNAKSNHTEAA